MAQVGTATRTGGGWVVTAGAVGFAISGVFSWLLHVGRPSFVLAHALIIGLFAATFVRTAHPDLPAELRRHPALALLAGVALGGVLLHGVTGQPGGAVPGGIERVAFLGWYGLVYGSADALLLTVIPVAAVTRVSGGGVIRKMGQAMPALGASLLVTALYHLGFEEFRGASLLQPLIGNAIVTAGYLATGNPLTPVLAHVIMHGAAVLHGMEVTVQLPPHY